jgi:DNA repair ATPase RecN
MQEDIRKRDSLIQDLYKQFQSPPSNDVAAELAKAKAEIQELKNSTSELRRGQENLVALSAEGDKASERGSAIHRGVKEKIGKWQEFLETPISVSRRSRPTPRQSRYKFLEW